LSTPRDLFFILGNPRSGTTLLRLMLNNHPEIAVPPECGFTEWLWEDFGQMEMNSSTYSAFLQKLQKTKKFETWFLDSAQLFLSIQKKNPKSYQELVLEVYMEYARVSGKNPTLLGDKNNYYINRVEKLNRIFPDCKKIFIVRDGRDVASSYLELLTQREGRLYEPKLEEAILDIANKWKESIRVGQKWTARGDICLRYEDLVENPKAALTMACHFLSLDYSESMLSYFSNNDEPNEFKSWKWKTFEPISTDSLGRYKTDLSNEQIDLFQAVAGSELVDCGYKMAFPSI
jgi:hypothetical protein